MLEFFVFTKEQKMIADDVLSKGAETKRYRVSGTFENLNKQYVNAIETKDKTIDSLRKQIVSLKNEMKGFTDFLSEYSLIDIFKEFIRPKTLKEKLEISKQKSSKLEQQKQKLTAITDKKHDIAI